ncbi:MAG TPA: cell division protein ZipA C-terminal FtsZ-binding domain-containing protein [Burkholderiales bacterium]|nr:cell division protein ZipA C-terminal FtsZ-binding domain-containing protein [Burkholderiales bacterium]
MTDLQLGLLVLGAVAVVGVVLYNRLQERAVRREAERAFASRHSDVLLGGEAEPRAGTVRELSGATVPAGAMPDPRLDYVLTLRIPVGLPAAAALESWHPIEQRFGRRVLLAGSDGSGWRPVAHGELGTFASLRAGLQMVSRGGVVSDAELIEFRTEVETLASRVRAECSAPEMRAALESARELDRFCADADIQVALHVVGEGIEVPADPEAAYQVSAQEKGVTFLLDMPRTEDPARAFEGMTRAARQLAGRSGGRLVDDRDQPLDERALAAIGAELEAVRRRLSERGLEPGSMVALRLFS